MIIVAGSIRVDPTDLDAWLAAGRPMVEATNTEEGCIEYGFHQDIADPTHIVIFERWESMDALQAHFVAPHMAEFQEAIGSLAVTDRDLWLYEADPVRQL